MNKKELRNMKLLEATDELIKLAKEDVPVRDEGYYTEQLIYQRGLYLRAEVENNILKVAFYLAEYLSTDVGNLYIHYTLIKRTMFLKGMITRQRNGQKVCWIRPFFQNGYIRKILI